MICGGFWWSSQPESQRTGARQFRQKRGAGHVQPASDFAEPGSVDDVLARATARSRPRSSRSWSRKNTGSFSTASVTTCCGKSRSFGWRGSPPTPSPSKWAGPAGPSRATGADSAHTRGRFGVDPVTNLCRMDMFPLREPRMSRKANELVRIFRAMDMLFSEAGLERQL